MGGALLDGDRHVKDRNTPGALLSIRWRTNCLPRSSLHPSDRDPRSNKSREKMGQEGEQELCRPLFCPLRAPIGLLCIEEAPVNYWLVFHQFSNN